MCTETIDETPSEAPSPDVQYGTAKVCIGCAKVASWDAYDAKRCEYCGVRVFTDAQVEIKHPWEDYKRPDIYEGEGNDYVPEWMQQEDDY